LIEQDQIVTIDGGRGEGGGQLLRTAVSLAAARAVPVRVHSIRAGRRSPGLQPQHLAAVRAVARVCRGTLEGDSPGSRELLFHPGAPEAGEYRFEVGTAGAATLVLQAVLPVLTGAGRSRLRIRGGTHVPWSPPADFAREVLAPLLRLTGCGLRVATERWGFYPKGGGELAVEIDSPAPLEPLTRVRRDQPIRLRGVSGVSRLPRTIADRQRDRALRRLEAAGYAADVTVEEREARDAGSFLFLVAEADGPLGGFTGLGRPGVPAERVADQAVDAFLEFARADAGCDPHLADQLVVPLALAGGTSRLTTSRVSRHLLTVLETAGQILGCPVQLRGAEGSPGSVTVEGVGRAGGRGPGVEKHAPEAESREAARGRGGEEASGISHSAVRPSRSALVRKARATDVPGMQRLLAHFAARGDVLPRTLNEMYQHLRDFFVCEEKGEILGLVALFLYWEDLAEVRSLAVREDAGGRGMGRALVEACLAEAGALGVRRVFALTNRPGFFQKLGFSVVDKRELPQKIWKDCIRCAKFDACDETALIRDA
jgi:RNA 3'-terminal phosphate cyclase (ATP)